MAYMTKESKGPYPNKAGEYCGNHIPGSYCMRSFDQTQQQANIEQQKWLARMRFGKPRSCKAGRSKYMAEQGYVGLYLKEDRPLYSGDTQLLLTPKELMEPE